MRRIALAVSSAAALAAVGWPVAQGQRAEPAVCERMTPARMLEHPALAEEYARALLSPDPGAVGRVEAMLRGVREAHGCGGEVALPREVAPRLPPGHPPIPAGPRAPAPSRALPFEAPEVFTI